MGKVTMSRGNDLTDLHRNRHHTDDSSIGSYKYEVNFASGFVLFVTLFLCMCTPFFLYGMIVSLILQILLS